MKTILLTMAVAAVAYGADATTAGVEKQLTFSKDIAPIFEKSCDTTNTGITCWMIRRSRTRRTTG